MGKSIFLKKGTVNTSIWYFLMSVYESKSINEDSRKHLSSERFHRFKGIGDAFSGQERGSKYTGYAK